MSRHPSLQAVVIGIFTVCALLVVGLTVLMLSYSSQVERRVSKLSEANGGVYAAEELRASLRAYNRTDYFSDTQKPDDYPRQLAISRIAKWKQAVARHVRSAREREVVSRLKDALDAYLPAYEQLTTQNRPSLERYRAGESLLQPIIADLDELVNVNYDEARKIEQNIEEESRNVRKLAILVCCALGLLLGGIAFSVRLVVYRPLQKIGEAIKDFGNGVYSTRAPLNGPREIAQIANVFNSMAASLNSRRTEQLSFLSGVAHDLRNPLGAIKMASEILMSDAKTIADSKTESIHGVVSRQVTHLNQLVNDLLDTTRIEAGKIKLECRQHDIRESIRDVCCLYSGISSKHTISCFVPPEPIYCDCDPARISQVMNNLVGNAIKYSPSGGEVQIEVKSGSQTIDIQVSDKGLGIPPDELPFIFEPFRRTTATEHTIPGVGLGLSVVRRIAEAHSGTIEVESELNTGSTFRLRLPLANYESEYKSIEIHT